MFVNINFHSLSSFIFTRPLQHQDASPMANMGGPVVKVCAGFERNSRSRSTVVRPFNPQTLDNPHVATALCSLWDDLRLSSADATTSGCHTMSEFIERCEYFATIHVETRGRETSCVWDPDFPKVDTENVDQIVGLNPACVLGFVSLLLVYQVKVGVNRHRSSDEGCVPSAATQPARPSGYSDCRCK